MGLQREMLRYSSFVRIVFGVLCTFLAADREAVAEEALAHIVQHCLNADDPCTGCKWPRSNAACALEKGCDQVLEIWRQNQQFLAIRDGKMCRCSAFHGLALPRQLIVGVEATPLPEGLWEFAWAVASDRTSGGVRIALLVNSKSQRTQHQLHIHLLRMQPDGLERLKALAPRQRTLESLREVWKAVKELSSHHPELSDYGVVVTGAGSKFLLSVFPPDRHLESHHFFETCK